MERFNWMLQGSGVSSMELRELEHPPQLWHNSKISISVTTIVTHNRKLPTIDSLACEIRSLNGCFSSLQGLKQPSLSASCLQECVNWWAWSQVLGRGLKFCARASRAIESAPPYLRSWIRHCKGWLSAGRTIWTRV